MSRSAADECGWRQLAVGPIRIQTSTMDCYPEQDLLERLINSESFTKDFERELVKRIGEEFYGKHSD